MNRYTIPCTAEQTKRALALGAPITNIHTVCNDGITKEWKLVIPTAEQMMGWLRTKGFAFGITEYNDHFNDHVSWRVANNQDKKWYISDNKSKDIKEAALAAIDAALDYLSDNKK